MLEPSKYGNNSYATLKEVPYEFVETNGSVIMVINNLWGLLNVLLSGRFNWGAYF